MKIGKRILSLILALCLLVSAALAEGVATPSDAVEAATEKPAEVPVTEVPVEEPTEVPVTEAPAEEPTEVPVTEAPTEKPTTAPVTEAPAEEPTEAPVTEAPAEEPTEVPVTEAPTEKPMTAPVTETPTEETTEVPVTEAPTEAPTEVPVTEAPTEEPSEIPETEAPTMEPTPEPWDESLCDHLSPECEQAPACDVPDCPHITQDSHGLDVPACDLGLWLLDAAENSGIAAYSVRSLTIDLDSADAKIYRSGAYTVTGGGQRSGKLWIAAGRAVVLNLKEAALDALTVEGGGALVLRSSGESAIGSLDVGSRGEVTFAGSGAQSIGSISLGSEARAAVESGSVKANFPEQGGRTMMAFPAQGAASASVNGQTVAAAPHADGSYYLWLPAADAGMKWVSILQGAALEIIQAADVPVEIPAEITSGTDNVLLGGKTYTLTGDVSAGTRLIIQESDITVVLDGASAGDTLIDASCTYTLHVKGSSVIDSFCGSGPAIISEGLLTVRGSLPADTQYLSGAFVLAQAPAGYAAFDAGFALDRQRLTVNGATHPLLMNDAGQLLLPQLAQGMTWAVTLENGEIKAAEVEEGAKAFTLTAAAPVAEAGAAQAFTVTGDGRFVDGRITASGAQANAEFRDVRLQSGGAVLCLDGEQLNVLISGDNTLSATSGDAISLANGSSLSLHVASGRLLIRSQSQIEGIALRGNILMEPEPDQPHVRLLIRDRSGNPVPNRSLTLLIGGQRYHYTTHYDGSLHLWGLGNIDGQEIAATDGEEVFTAVVMGGEAEMTTGLDLAEVIFTSQPDGSLLMTWQAEGAGSSGVQLVWGDQALDMADDFVQGAMQIAGSGLATVEGIPAGSVVTARLYATAGEGASLTAESADGFQFGQVQHYVHRGSWGPDKSANATYTGKPYRNPLSIPEGASVSYSGDLTDGKPVDVGEYTMRVTIPEGHPVYLPGTVKVDFEIRKIRLIISPAPNQQKYKTRPDPEYAYTVSGLMEGDAVTGVLTREPGEEPGEYAWLLDGLSAPAYYSLRLDSEAMPFLILPLAPAGGILVDEIMNPVVQKIVRSDGRRLKVTLHAADSIQVSGSVLGGLVRDEKDAAQLATPSLHWNERTDEVLLRLRAEPELNRDQGYKTDSAGRVIWGTRVLRLSYMGLTHMRKMGIDALALEHNGACITVRVEDFLTADMEKVIKAAGGNLTSTVFRIMLAPVTAAPAEIAPVTQGWHVRAVMGEGAKEQDISALLPGMMAAVDMESVADMLLSAGIYDEAAFPHKFTLMTGEGVSMASVFVAPFQADELDKADFPSMMSVSRYLMTKVTGEMTLYAVKILE